MSWAEVVNNAIDTAFLIVITVSVAWVAVTWLKN